MPDEENDELVWAHKNKRFMDIVHFLTRKNAPKQNENRTVRKSEL